MSKSLTPNALRTLRAIAYMVGEPDGTFTAEQVSAYMTAPLPGEDVPWAGPTVRGLKTHTLPALMRRGYIVPTPGVFGWHTLTDAGFDRSGIL